jgi:hypothetical protein
MFDVGMKIILYNTGRAHMPAANRRASCSLDDGDAFYQRVLRQNNAVRARGRLVIGKPPMGRKDFKTGNLLGGLFP